MNASESSEDRAYLKGWMARVTERSTMEVGGCWIWEGHTNHKGYGYTSWQGQNVAIHRKIYEAMHGVLLIEEQFVCHTCDERRCWNPAHLFLGDAKANNNDCARKARHHNTVKTHCKFGHPYDEKNTERRMLPTGSIARTCLTCEALRLKTERYKAWRRQYQRQRREKQKLARSTA